MKQIRFSPKVQLAIFVIALLVRLILVSLFATKPVNDLLWNDAVGWNLAQGNGFTASQAEPRVPAIYRTPGYPAFLAVLYFIFGHNYIPVYIAQALLDAASAILLGRIILQYSSQLLGTATSLLYALYPYPGMFCGVIHQDILLVFSTLLTLFVITQSIRGDRLRMWLLVGLMLSITALVKPNMILLLIVPLICLLFYFRQGRLNRILLVCAALVLTLLPWLLRNYLVFGGFPPLSAGATGNNLRLLVLELNQGEEALRQVGLGPPRTEVQGFTDGQKLIEWEKREAIRNARILLDRWPEYSLLILKHIPRLWITRYSRWHGDTVALGASVLSWVVLITGVAGMVLLLKHWRRLLPLYLWVIFITLMYAPYTPEARYTLPARPLMLFFVAAMLFFVLEKLGARGLSGDQPERQIAQNTRVVSSSK